MNFGDLIPISLFICIAYSIKVCVDAMVRRHMVNAGGSEELVNSVLRDENLRRRHSSLRVRPVRYVARMRSARPSSPVVGDASVWLCVAVTDPPRQPGIVTVMLSATRVGPVWTGRVPRG